MCGVAMISLEKTSQFKRTTVRGLSPGATYKAGNLEEDWFNGGSGGPVRHTPAWGALGSPEERWAT